MCLNNSNTSFQYEYYILIILLRRRNSHRLKNRKYLHNFWNYYDISIQRYFLFFTERIILKFMLIILYIFPVYLTIFFPISYFLCSYIVPFVPVNFFLSFIECYVAIGTEPISQFSILQAFTWLRCDDSIRTFCNAYYTIHNENMTVLVKILALEIFIEQ